MANCISVKYPLTIVEDGTFDRDFIWESGDPSTPVDLTGFTAKMTVRSSLDSIDPPLLYLEYQNNTWAPDIASGIYINDPVSGTFKAYITDEDTYGLCAEHVDIAGVYDIFLINPDDEYVFRLYGSCKIKAAVTRV